MDGSSFAVRRESGGADIRTSNGGEQKCIPQERDADADNTARLLCKAATRCGMRSEAREGWETVHENPYYVFLVSTCSSLIIISRNALVVLASRPFRWDFHAPGVLCVLSGLVWISMMWRYGPAASNTKMVLIAAFMSMGLQLSTSLRLMLGPIELVPFQSRLGLVFSDAAGAWLGLFTMQLGWWVPDHPKEPYRSFVAPVIAAAIRTLRVTDAITDMLVIQMMLRQAQEPCFWFGVREACERWVALAACAGVFAIVDLVSSIFLALGGSGAGGHATPSRLRLFRSVHVVAFMCELGILSVTLVKLFSDFDEPASSASPAERRNAVTLTVVSFAITVVSFTVTMVGLRSMLQAAARVGVSVRQRMSHSSRGEAATCKAEPQSRDHDLEW